MLSLSPMKCLTFTLAAFLAASPALADTLVTNANGLQVSSDGKLERFTGILIGDDGKVKRLLRGEKLKLGGDTKVVDAQGRTVLPGLIDAHGHVMALGFAALQLDLTGTRSLDEFKQRLKAYAAANPGSGWILGRGWNQELWADKSFPTAADLDSVVADRPVWLSRVDGHASVGNSAAMRAAGVTAETRAPAGGQIIDGLFVDNAEGLVTKSIPAPDAATRARALGKAQELMLSVGLTAAADMGTSADDWTTLRRAGEAGTLKLRVFSYAAGLDGWRAINGGKPTGWMYGDRLRLVGTKLYADGALGSRGAWLKAPYHDKPDTRGLSLASPAELLSQASEIADGGGQLAIHAIGDQANDDVIGVFEQLTGRLGKTRRWRIEHLQIADPSDLPRLKPAGIIASMQPTHQTSDWQMAEARLSTNRLGGAYAWRTVEQLGVPLAFGSDFPVEHPNPYPGLAAAISRETLEGKPPGGWRPQEKISLASALKAFTRGAAYAGLAEDKIGSLDPGHYADFIIVDRDPAKVGAQALARTKVLETWVAGKREFSADAVPAK
jgi:predicted amidohydrolase YtcJ